MSNQHNFPLLGQAFIGSKILSANFSLSGTDSGKAFTNAPATGSITITLPLSKPGLVYYVKVVSAHNIVIQPQTADAIQGSTAGTPLTLSVVGTTAVFVCYTPGIWDTTFSNTFNSGIVVTGASTFTGPVTISMSTAGVPLTVVTTVAGQTAAIFTTPSDIQVRINAAGSGQFSTLQFTQNGTITGQLFSDNTNGFMELAVNNGGANGFKISQGTGPIVGRGPIAAAFVDMTPDRGTFTLTHTGFTTGVTSTATWYRIGNIVILNTGTVTGTSNATTWTATGLPAGIQSSLIAQVLTIGDAENNGAGVAATVSVGASGTLTFGNGFISGGAWTNAGVKGFFNSGGTTFSYLLG